MFTGANPSYTVAELERHFKISNAKFFVTEPTTAKNVRKAAQACGITKPSVWLFDEHLKASISGYSSWRELLIHGEADWIRFNDENTAKNTTAALLFSSGTTGLPKAVMISHQNLVAQHTMFLGRNKRPYEVGSCPLHVNLERIEKYSLLRQVSQLLFTPQFHVGSLPFSHLAMLKEGFKTYHSRRFELELYLRSVEQYKITDILIVAAALQVVVRSPLANAKTFQSIRNVLTSGSPVALSTQEAFRGYLPPGTPVTQIFGMTEMTGYSCALLWPEDDHTNSVGKLLPNLSARYVCLIIRFRTILLRLCRDY